MSRVVAKLVATVRSNAKIVEKYLSPIILERLEKAKDGDDWEGKPVSFFKFDLLGYAMVTIGL